MPFEIVRNDITRMSTDAIVNPANSSLLGGGGVDGAIHRAAGPELLEECRGLGGCRTGEAKITKGYRLPAKYVIHTVGPVWRGGGYGEKELLSACYRNSLRLAEEARCESVAFPLISAGAYGYPQEEAMSVAVDTITAFLETSEMTVYLVLFGHGAFITGKKLYRDVVEYIDDVYAETRVSARRAHVRESLWRRDEAAGLDFDQRLAAEEPEYTSPNLNAPSAPMAAAPSEGLGKKKSALPNWKELLKRTDEGFSPALLRMIDERGMTDAQCYKRANVDRKLFSKIRSNPDYKPGKTTVFAFAVALELTLAETKDLLRRAGFAISRSSKLDIVMEYCIQHGVYNVYEINEVLFSLDLPLLGSGFRG